MMTFDEAIYQLETRTIFNHSGGLLDQMADGVSFDAVIKLIKELKNSYFPPVEMTQKQKDFLLSGEMSDEFAIGIHFYNSDGKQGYEVFNYKQTERDLINAFNYPELIKVVDDES